MVTAPGLLTGPLADTLAELHLVDHHVHGSLRADVDRATFESMITEAPHGQPDATQFDSQVGFAIRRWCAPLLDLLPHADADTYWQRRTELGNTEVTRRLLAATGTDTYLIETGYRGNDVLNPAEHATASGATAREIVRLETLAEELLDAGTTGAQFVDAYPDALRAATAGAVGVKSILAYRYGFDIPPQRPEPAAVREAAARAASGPGTPRIDDPVLLRYLLWSGVDTGLPVQLHCGYGDPDLDLHRANPALLTGWLRQVQPTGTPVMLLHCYPYHREAGYLAQVFDNVYFDVGEGINYVGAQSVQLVAESFEVAPFQKQLFSSDAWGPAELHLLGSWLWRRAMATVLGRFVADDDWSLRDARRVAGLIAHRNAERVYRL